MFLQTMETVAPAIQEGQEFDNLPAPTTWNWCFLSKTSKSFSPKLIDFQHNLATIIHISKHTKLLK